MKLQLLYTLLSLLHLSAGDPRLVCPETVVTQIGDNVTLPCHLEPEHSIEDEEVECRRSNLDVLVYYCHNGEQMANYIDQYKHRTSMNTEELKSGILNLKISSVRQSDNGTYNIYIHTWGISAAVILVVGDPPSGDPPPGDPPPGGHSWVLYGVLGVGVVFTLAVLLILDKRKVIQRCWSNRMMMKVQMSQHGDEDPHRAAGNGHLDPEQPAESETMLELQL